MRETRLKSSYTQRKDGPIPIPAIPRSDRKISILARSIDAFDTARDLPTESLVKTMFSLINLNLWLVCLCCCCNYRVLKNNQHLQCEATLYLAKQIT